MKGISLLCAPSCSPLSAGARHFVQPSSQVPVRVPLVGDFSPRDLEVMNLKEGHLDSLWQGLTSLFLQSSFFIEAGTKNLKYMASRVHMELTHNQ